MKKYDPLTFISKFKKLKEWIDDEPEKLEKYAADDDSIAELCAEMSSMQIGINEQITGYNVCVVKDIDQTFINFYREYEIRYMHAVQSADIAFMRKRANQFAKAAKSGEINGFLADFFANIDFDLLAEVLLARRTNKTWEHNRIAGQETAKAIKNAIEYAVELFGRKNKKTHIKKIEDEHKEALELLVKFIDRSQIDLEGALRRFYVCPDIFVPDQISKRFNKHSYVRLYDHLNQALQAFIVGSLAGTVALLRAILENVLVEHYQSSGSDLSELINRAKGLPPSIRQSDLHNLRRIANNVLHTPGAYSGLQSSGANGAAAFEKDVLALLMLVRDLVEGSPRWSHRDGEGPRS